jgi:Phosphoenolpyruvate-protein kinase (PTS system EI component in bacteria)
MYARPIKGYGRYCKLERWKLGKFLAAAVLRLVKQVIDQGHAAGIWVGLRGEMIAEPRAIPILLGLGLDEFSMNPTAIPQAKGIIRR